MCIRDSLGDEADFTRPEVYTWFEEYLKQEISQLRCEQEMCIRDRDSTNVIIPVVSVITNVSLDHTDRCGATVERIAMQKAGIIKENVPVVDVYKRQQCSRYHGSTYD